MRSANVRVLWETFDGASGRKKANGVPDTIEHAAAPQTRRVTGVRGLKKADREVDFFFIQFQLR